METRQITDAAKVREFMMAGKAKVTFRSAQTDNRFTFQVSVPQGKRGDATAPHFVKVLMGSNNDGDYTFLGTVFADGNYKHGGKSPISAGAPSERVFQWVWKYVSQGVMPKDLEVFHEGCCGRCGRTLTVPESIESGFGPECIHLVRS